MLTNREFHLQTGNLAYKTGFSFTKRESWVTKGILGLLFTVKDKNVIWKYPNAVKYDVIKANDELEVELKTEEIQEDKVSIQFDFRCNDKYGEEHKYHVYSFCESNSSTPYFSIKEIFEENP